jgi:hypothetical protein
MLAGTPFAYTFSVPSVAETPHFQQPAGEAFLSMEFRCEFGDFALQWIRAA